MTTRAGAGHEREPHRGDNRERALAADEQRGQVVAGVVLDEPRQPPQHAPVGQHRLEAGDPGAHRAVAQHLRAAGVRRDHPADRRRVAGGEVDAEREPGPAQRGRQRRRRHAGADRDLRRDGVHRPDLAEPRERQHHLAAARHLPADEPGVPALRHDGGARRPRTRRAPPRPPRCSPAGPPPRRGRRSVRSRRARSASSPASTSRRPTSRPSSGVNASVTRGTISALVSSCPTM